MFCLLFLFVITTVSASYRPPPYSSYLNHLPHPHSSYHHRYPALLGYPHRYEYSKPPYSKPSYYVVRRTYYPQPTYDYRERYYYYSPYARNSAPTTDSGTVSSSLKAEHRTGSQYTMPIPSQSQFAKTSPSQSSVTNPSKAPYSDTNLQALYMPNAPQSPESKMTTSPFLRSLYTPYSPDVSTKKVSNLIYSGYPTQGMANTLSKFLTTSGYLKSPLYNPFFIPYRALTYDRTPVPLGLPSVLSMYSNPSVVSTYDTAPVKTTYDRTPVQTTYDNSALYKQYPTYTYNKPSNYQQYPTYTYNKPSNYKQYPTVPSIKSPNYSHLVQALYQPKVSYLHYPEASQFIRHQTPESPQKTPVSSYHGVIWPGTQSLETLLDKLESTLFKSAGRNNQMQMEYLSKVLVHDQKKRTKQADVETSKKAYLRTDTDIEESKVNEEKVEGRSSHTQVRKPYMPLLHGPGGHIQDITMKNNYDRLFPTYPKPPFA